MNGEFSRACIGFYHLDLKRAKEEELYETMLANAVPFTGQTDTKILDRFMRYNRKVQAAGVELRDTTDVMVEVGAHLVKMMEYFEIPPNTRLTCEVPNEVEIQIWADEDNQVHYEKIRDIEPSPNLFRPIKHEPFDPTADDGGEDDDIVNWDPDLLYD